MQGVTLLIGVMGSIMALSLSPVYALVAYVGTLIWYPDYLRVSIGTIDISVGRIVVAVLLMRCLLDSKISKTFVWSRFDKLVTLSMAIYVVTYCAANPSSQAIENRGGFLIDTWFSYMAARMILKDKAALVSFVKGVSIVLVPLAILGVIEAVTSWQPFYQLIRFRTWRQTSEVITRNRMGFTRAIGPFSHFIMFGGFFCMFLPLVWALRRQRGDWKKLAYICSVSAVLGALSSMSSVSWGMLIVVVLCLYLERYKRWLKVVLISLALLCLMAEIGSNRPLYHVVMEVINLAKGDWYQRARLIDVAIDHFDEWWLAGYGGNDPGWGQMYFYADFTDVNNEFILAGINHGIVGVIALFSVFVMAFRGLVRAFKKTKDKQMQAFYWSLGSALVGMLALSQGVSFFGQMNALFYCLLAIVGASTTFPEQAAEKRIPQPDAANLISYANNPGMHAHMRTTNPT
ncbi:MAG: O-antigen ligase family protein [Sedimentisphaerales bacterium]|nr:O-antigen ligase family protein [Sedimentisphaerales bacterium]